MALIDTHCHIHSVNYPLEAEAALQRARTAGVEKLICVGTDEHDSARAVAFAERHGIFASIGIHPHHAVRGVAAVRALDGLAANRKVIAVGECGLDFYYTHAPRQAQFDLLHVHLQLAAAHHLPLIFHVRNAFDEFWPIFEQYPGVHGVLHSFTDSRANMEKALSYGLFIGVNGISTFTKDPAQQQMFTAIPLSRLILETDAPFLTPVPLRGRVNEPAFVTHVALHHADLRTTSLKELSAATSQNATTLFNLN